MLALASSIFVSTMSASSKSRDLKICTRTIRHDAFSIIMELVEGQTLLHQRITAGAIPADEALRIARSDCRS